MKIEEIKRENFLTWDGKGRNNTRLYDAAYRLLIETAKKEGFTELSDFEGRHWNVFGREARKFIEYIVDFFIYNIVNLIF